MDSNELLSTLHVLEKLSREESFVLFYKLRRESHLVIGQKMGLGEDRVQQLSSACYRAFYLEGRQWRELRNKTQPIMMRVAKPVGWDIWQWPTQDLLDEIRRSSKPSEINPPSQSPGNIFRQMVVQPNWQTRILEIAQNRTVQIIAFIVLIILLGILIIPNIFHQGRGQNQLLFGTQPAVLSSIVVSHATTPTPIHSINAVQEQTPTSSQIPTLTLTPTVSPSATITLTPSITNTPTVTDTPTVTITPSPTEDVFFFQDFGAGGDFDPRWQIIDPDHILLVGGLVSDSWMVLPTKGLKNFRMEVTGIASGTGVPGMIISPAFVDPANYLALRTNYLQRSWWYCKSGMYGACGELWGNTAELPGNLIVVMTVINKNVDLEINHIKFASVYNNKIPFGNIAINTAGAGISSVKIIRLPK